MPADHRLNLGCGSDIRPRAQGWVNADIAALPGVDLRFNAFRLPWPLKTGSLSEVFSSHFLEHVPHDLEGRDGFVALMEETHRVLRPGGRVVAVVPLHHGPIYWADPTHRRVITVQTFQYFTPHSTHPWYSRARFRILQTRREASYPRWPDALPIRGIGLFMHLWDRLPWLRWAMPRRPTQLRVELERL